jgi:predicted DNA-binding antitoxin AbrB/MazE fold protein
MAITIEAIYENGLLKPQQPLVLGEGTKVRLTVTPLSEDEGSLASPGGLSSERKSKRADEELEKRFRNLVRQWQRETSHFSSTARMARHPAYQEIIGMGEAVVPLLLAELQRKPDFWFAALRAITGKNPVPAESAGKVKEMAQAWLAWGKAEGLLP